MHFESSLAWCWGGKSGVAILFLACVWFLSCGSKVRGRADACVKGGVVRGVDSGGSEWNGIEV